MKAQRLLERAEIPPRYLGRGFDAFAPQHPLQEKALRTSVEYVETYPATEQGLIFVGPCGVGKTHLSVAILQTLIEERQIRARFVDETEFLRRLQYSYNPNTPETEKELLSPLMQADLLVWDDLGTGRPTEWAKETIRTVINYRYTNRRHTVFTTNRLIAGRSGKGNRDWAGGEHKEGEESPLAERVGQHLFSRIMEMCETVEVRGPDARTEIHKAAYDFRRNSKLTKSKSPEVPDGLLTCPKCQSKEVEKLDFSAVKASPKGSFVEIACRCAECQEQFLARYFSHTSEVHYPARESRAR
jgi:DNA replication protein DnaC